MDPSSFSFKLTVPNDPTVVSIVAEMARHAADYAKLEGAAADGFVERARGAAVKALKGAPGHSCLAVFAAGDGALTSLSAARRSHSRSRSVSCERSCVSTTPSPGSRRILFRRATTPSACTPAAYRLCARAYRQLPDVRLRGRAAPRAEVRGRLQDAPRHELHRRGRQDHCRRGKAGLPLREYTDQYITAFREDAAALGIEAVEETPRATDPDNLEGDGRHDQRARPARSYLYDRRVDLLQDRDAAVLREARAPRPRRHPGGRAGRLRRVRQGKRARLRAVEGHQAGRADLGLRLRPGPSGLAHRVLGDGDAVARRPAEIFTPAASTWCSRITRTRSRRAKAPPARSSHASGFISSTCWSTTRRCRSRSATSTRCRTCSRRVSPVGIAVDPAVGLLPQAAELHVDGLEQAEEALRRMTDFLGRVDAFTSGGTHPT